MRAERMLVQQEAISTHDCVEAYTQHAMRIFLHAVPLRTQDCMHARMHASTCGYHLVCMSARMHPSTCGTAQSA